MIRVESLSKQFIRAGSGWKRKKSEVVPAVTDIGFSAADGQPDCWVPTVPAKPPRCV